MYTPVGIAYYLRIISTPKSERNVKKLHQIRMNDIISLVILGVFEVIV